jgi:exosortase family protein XrtM
MPVIDSSPRLIRQTVLVVGFLTLYVAFHTIWVQAQGTWLERLVVDKGTVAAAAAVIDALNPRLGVFAQGTRIVGPVGSLSVLPGCDGTEAMFLLAAAFLVYPQPIARGITGFAIGAALVYVLNLLRIVTLFYAARSDTRWFELLHAYVAPTLLIALTGLFFLLWVSRSGSLESSRRHAAA